MLFLSCSFIAFGQKYIDRELERRVEHEKQVKTWSGRYDVTYSWQNPMMDTLIVVKRKGLYGISNLEGKERLPTVYDKITWFKNDLALVKNNDKYGFLNRDLEWKIPLKYEYAE